MPGARVGRKKRKPAQKQYVATNRRYRNKSKRILQSCGSEFLKEWQDKYRRRAYASQ